MCAMASRTFDYSQIKASDHCLQIYAQNLYWLTTFRICFSSEILGTTLLVFFSCLDEQAKTQLNSLARGEEEGL